MADMNQSPRLLRWDLVSSCNLSCTHCCVGPMLRDETTVDLSTSEVFKGLWEARQSGVEQVHFLGGEPTIRKDFIDICLHARSLGLEVSFNTNGIRQGPKYLESIFEINPRAITISIDGPDAESHDTIRGKGNFEKTCEFVRKLVAKRRALNVARPLIQVQAVLTSSWVHKASQIVELSAALEADALVINNLADMGDAIDNSDKMSVNPVAIFNASIDLLRVSTRFPNMQVTAPIRLKVLQYYRELTGDRSFPLEMNSCPSIDDNIHINYDGSLTPCQLAQEQGLGLSEKPTSILDGNLLKAMDSKPFKIFKTAVKESLEKTYKDQLPCNRCHFLGNGCKPCPISSDSTSFKTNYQCLIAETLLTEARTKKSFEPIESTATQALMAEAVVQNPKRPRPLGRPLFEDTSRKVFRLAQVGK